MKLKSLFTLFIVLFCICVSVSAFAQSGTDEDFENVEKFLSQLDVIEGIEKKADDKINRAEFAAMALRAMNIDAQETSGTDFTDLKDNNFASEIYMAKSLGLTNGTSASTFSPDGDVSVQVAAKMLVTALGYGQYADAIGGYPTGHFRIARSLGIFKGIENTEGPMTVKEAYTCIYNALYADKVVFKSISGDNIEVEQIPGRNLLTENFKLSNLSGIVTTVGYCSVNPEYADKDVIEVSGKVLKMENAPREYLGYTADVWYDADTDKVRAVSVAGKNKAVKIDAADVIDYSGYRLRVYTDSGKEVKYSFDKGLTFVQNGRAIVHSASSFKFDTGTLTLVDNDGDGSFEYVISEKIDYFRISAINKSTIYDSKSLIKCIDFEKDDCGYEIEINGVKASFQELQADMVCEVMMSQDREVCLVRTNGVNKLAGVVEEISDEQLFIDGTAYDLNPYFKSLGLQVSPGKSYSFLLAPDGSITAISGAVTGDISYGYLLGYISKKTLSTSPQVKLLTSYNQIEAFELADKIRLNGILVSSNASAVSDLLLNGEYPRYQLIRYKLKDGKITMIDTSEIASDDWESLADNYNEDDYLKRYVRAEIHYRQNIGFGVPNISFKGSVIFSVPKALWSNPNAYYADELFSIISPDDIANGEYFNAEAYDFDENFIPSATILYNPQSGVSYSAPGELTTQHMVYQVTDAANPEGDVTKLIKVYSPSSKVYNEYYVDLNALSYLTTNSKVPSPGDVVRFTFNSKGYINGIGLDVDYDIAKNTVKINYGVDEVSTLPFDILSYFSGTAYTETDGYLTIKADNVPKKADAETPAKPSAKNSSNLVNLVINPSAKYVVFNTNTGKITLGSSDDIITTMQGGAENASYVVCKSTYYYVGVVYIYVN